MASAAAVAAVNEVAAYKPSEQLLAELTAADQLSDGAAGKIYLAAIEFKRMKLCWIRQTPILSLLLFRPLYSNAFYLESVGLGRIFGIAGLTKYILSDNPAISGIIRPDENQIRPNPSREPIWRR